MGKNKGDESLAKQYGDINVKRGRVHEDLGMDLDYTKPGQVKVSMKQYMKGYLKFSRGNRATDSRNFGSRSSF